MIPRPASPIVLWALVIVCMVFQGCTTGGPAGWSNKAGENNQFDTAGPWPETADVTSEEMEPFLGNWQGDWEEDYAIKSVSTTSETRRALLSVRMVSGKPMVVWALGTGVGGGTWHGAHASSPPSLGKYPSKFGKKEGEVYLEFTTRLGNNYRFMMKGEQLYGVNTSPGFSVRCRLMKSTQASLFTDASLAQYRVGLN